MNLSRFAPHCLTLTLLAATGSVAAERYDHGNSVARVAHASETFVELFNSNDSEALGDLYVANGSLKLPGALVVDGRQNVIDAWQAGFDAGLDSLVLDVDSLRASGPRRVLESGSYELTIETPDGPFVQVGTYAVLWRVPANRHRSPRIIFDTIDAD